MNNSEVTITRQDLASGKHAYRITGTIAGEVWQDSVVIAASKVVYTHAAVTTLTDGQEVLSFHKTEAAAAKGNPQIARGYHARVQVIEIGIES